MVPRGRGVGIFAERVAVGVDELESVQVICPSPEPIQLNLSHFALGIESKRVVMGGPILPPVADTLKLRPGAPTVGKLDQAGLRLVDLQRVVQAGTPRAHVGQAEPDVTNLALDGQIELMDAPIPRLEGEAFDALRRNLGKSQVGGKRIGESKKRRP